MEPVFFFVFFFLFVVFLFVVFWGFFWVGVGEVLFPTLFFFFLWDQHC